MVPDVRFLILGAVTQKSEHRRTTLVLLNGVRLALSFFVSFVKDAEHGSSSW